MAKVSEKGLMDFMRNVLSLEEYVVRCLPLKHISTSESIWLSTSRDDFLAVSLGVAMPRYDLVDRIQGL